VGRAQSPRKSRGGCGWPVIGGWADYWRRGCAVGEGTAGCTET
jgi:hypothetical protein